VRLIEEVLKLKDITELKNEISERYKLINIMVGNLYPSIIQDEIIKIKELIYSIKYS